MTTLRELIADPECSLVLENIAKGAPFPDEAVLDEMYEVISRMLAQEDRFTDAFPSVYALGAYLKKVSFRELVRKHRHSNLHTTFEEFMIKDQASSPEDNLLQALQHQKLSDLFQRSIHVQKASRKVKRDIETLFSFLKNHGDTFIKKRQSGPQKGSLVFDLNGLTASLGWQRNRLYDRLERLKELLEKAWQAEQGTDK